MRPLLLNAKTAACMQMAVLFLINLDHNFLTQIFRKLTGFP